MGKIIMTDLLILGTAITGVIMALQFIEAPHGFMLMNAIINLGTALFLAVVVRPLLQGRVGSSKFLAHASLLILLGAWGAAFWIEYLTLSHLPSSLAGALTWSVAALVYVGDLLFSREPEHAVENTAEAPSAEELELVHA